jgi:hypothetical protein
VLAAKGRLRPDRDGGEWVDEKALSLPGLELVAWSQQLPLQRFALRAKCTETRPTAWSWRVRGIGHHLDHR